MKPQDDDPFEIYVHWLDDKGKIDKGTRHSISVYDGVVPVIGDKLAIRWEDGPDLSACEVVERYHVDNEDGPFWHIVLKFIDLPEDRAKGLGLI